MSSSIDTADDRRRRGVVLVVVLGFVLLLSWLAIAILDSVRRELAVEPRGSSRHELRVTAYQLLEVSVAVLAEIRRFEEDLYSPVQGWGIPLAYAGIEDSPELDTAAPDRGAGNGGPPEDEADAADPGGDDPEAVDGAEDPGAFLDDFVAEVGEDGGPRASEAFARPVPRLEATAETAGPGPETATLSLPEGIDARVRITDESGKLPLLATGEDRWNLFFEELGFEQSEAKILTDSLLDWMDPDDEERENGAETATYSQEDPPYRAANRRLRAFRELRLLRGFKDLFFDDRGVPNQRYETFRDHVSLHHEGEVNLNTAGLPVLETLAEEQGFEAANVLDFLAGADLEFGTADDRVLRPGLAEEELPKDGE